MSGFMYVCLHVWIYKNGTPKSTIWKLKGKSVLFFLPLPGYLPFIALLSLVSARLLGLKIEVGKF